MAKKKRQKRALISVFYKEGIEVIGKRLEDLGWEIVSSGGTASYLRKHGISCIDVAEITNYPAILGHRVVTLHPAVHGGILAEDIPEHRKEMKKYNIDFIDLVIVDVYPVWEALANLIATVRDVIEKTDIGGPTMLRAAAKNHDRVAVVCDPADREKVLLELMSSRRGVTRKTKLYLAQKVFTLTSRYDASIREFLAKQQGQLVEAIFLENGKQLAYAENRDQNPAFIFSDGSDDPLAMSKFKVVSGDPSFITMADGSQVEDILCLLVESFARWMGSVPFIVVAGKHGNPCGAAIDWSDPKKAIQKTLLGDPVAVMGGEVVVNFPITAKLGKVLFAPGPKIDIGRENWGLDVIFAPKFSRGAVKLLGRREGRRLMDNPALMMSPGLPSNEWIYRQVRGGFLKQKAPQFVLTPREVVKYDANLSNEDFSTLLVAWAVCWRASSNTVTLAKDQMLIGVGCGQQDRIACVRLCLERANRAGHNIAGSYFASDGFFPYAKSKSNYVQECKMVAERARRTLEEYDNLFEGEVARTFISDFGKLASFISQLDRREGPELLADAGCAGGVVPADGKNLEFVREFFREASMNVAFVAKEHRGFSKH